MHRLYIFTGTYPYGFRESFLEQEVPYLVKAFSEVIIIPLGGEGQKCRDVPKGVRIDNRLQIKRGKKIFLGLLNLWRVFPLYYADFFRAAVCLNFNKLKKWLKTTLITSYYLQSKVIKELKGSLDHKDVIYYYWGVEYNSVALYLKGKCPQVSRFHGDWDLWYNGGIQEVYSPCREKTIMSLDCAATISNKGNLFLKAHYPYLNVQTFRLGSCFHGTARKSSDGVLRVLSCSSVYAIKRVAYIYRCLVALSEKGRIIEWTHIGDGPQFEDLASLCKANHSTLLHVNLLGRKTHDAVLAYYKNNIVDIFINLSTNEGIPVAIMEAISFNVPVVATNVGATQEIVTSETGVLVPASPSVDEVGRAIEKVVETDWNPQNYWRIHYDADKNYQNFAKYLKTL